MTNSERVQAFYDRYYDLFLKKLRAFAGRDAEDLAQATFVRLLQKAHLHDPTVATFVTFATHIARNLWIENWRREQTALRHRERVARPIVQGEPVDETLIRQERDAIRRTVLADALASLSSRRRAVFDVRMEGIIDRGEIARRCGLATPSVAHNLLNAAFASIRKAMAAAEG